MADTGSRAWVLGGVGFLALVFAALGVSASVWLRGAQARRDALQPRYDALLVRYRAMRVTHPPVGGAALDCDAGARWDTALADTSVRWPTLPTDEAFYRGTRPLPGDVRAAMTRHQAHLLDLASIVRCTEYRTDAFAARTRSLVFRKLTALRWLTLWSVTLAPDEALPLLVRVARLSQDRAWEDGFLGVATDGAQSATWLAAVARVFAQTSPAVRAQLRPEMEALAIRELPRGRVLGVYHLGLLSETLPVMMSGIHFPKYRAALRELMDSVALLPVSESLADGADRLFANPTLDRRAFDRAVTEAVAALTRHDATFTSRRMFADVFNRGDTAVVRRRALAWALGSRASAALRDPFVDAGALHTEGDEGHGRVWSVGPNGRDESGTGDDVLVEWR